MAGIYIHIPFCKQACSYCNFHFSTSQKLQPAVISAICQELALRKNFTGDEIIDSVYLGGGTPSLLSAVEIDMLFKSVYDNFNIAPTAEITLEANPDDLTAETVRLLSDSPVNRLSIGIQSFFDADLRYMHRVHSSAEGNAALERCIRAGFRSLTIDLIYGTPTMTMEQWVQNLEKVVQYDIAHLSAYQLTVEPRTMLEARILKDSAPAPDDERTIAQFEVLLDWADDHGYEHYEISNLAKPGHRAVHNGNYWKRRPYLGVGPSAHSFANNRRLWNIANNALYLRAMQDGLAIEDEEMLSPQDCYNELVMTGLRTSSGVSLTEIGAVDVAFVRHFEDSIQPSLAKGHVQCRNGHYILTRAGKAFADRIASDCFITVQE